MTGMNERETLQRLAKEVEGLRGRLNQIVGQLEQVDAVLVIRWGLRLRLRPQPPSAAYSLSQRGRERPSHH